MIPCLPPIAGYVAFMNTAGFTTHISTYMHIIDLSPIIPIGLFKREGGIAPRIIERIILTYKIIKKSNPH